MYRLRPAWVLPITLLSILPLVIIGFFVAQRLIDLNEARYDQEVVAARYASEVAAEGIRNQIRDHFRPWRQALTLAHVKGEEEFQSKLRKMYLTSPLVESPQFVEEATLLKHEISADDLLPAGMNAEDTGHRCDLVSIAALRQALFMDGHMRMRFDPKAKRFGRKKLISPDEIEDVAPIRWIQIKSDSSLINGCSGCEQKLLEMGSQRTPTKIVLLTVLFPLPGGAGMRPGMFGAIIPADAFLHEAVAPALYRFGSGYDALPRHGLRIVDAENSIVLPKELPADPDAAHALKYSAELHTTALLGEGSPWQLQVVALSGFDRAQVRAENGRWSLLISLAAVLLVAGAVLFGRSFLHNIEETRTRSHLLSNVSHELKTPLSLIRLYSDTLESGRTRTEEERGKFLGIIGREAKRLSHLIDNLLDVQRIEENRKQYSFAFVRPDRVVRNTFESYKFQLVEEGFSVKLDVDDDLPLLHIDEDAVAQALINLLDNAAKYSDTRKEIRLACKMSHNRVCISVHDKGIGIPPREQQKIFQSFYRVEKGLVHDVKGSGLGLSVVAHVAEAHGGTVEVESTPGGGSTFSICLPTSFEPQES